MAGKVITIFLLAFIFIQSTNALDKKNSLITDEIVFPDDIHHKVKEAEINNAIPEANEGFKNGKNMEDMKEHSSSGNIANPILDNRNIIGAPDRCPAGYRPQNGKCRKILPFK
ncbi:uncharacterized protein LOC117178686 [Belonocnema kinseyi]|uniref:uncharacterized protein LOC117178686 n=1 Tax=Belonocnema kinseyi TaxID=2817044 RepID=UPI00143D64FB|nr:uncharacterized protein LOC117178686 [Belonocnema kinseyi]XP_033226003.1 uncharacterized protein LOC117178686 [Belonocnema kinseyi]XP_033226004.1 uncharacterized protein LOC117178686 [Belonocnema kinseyi]XP_033226005.1 uncharacterized protein LOC117178686 [Belonocnema kinseyi]